MASIVLPADNRWGSLGQGLGGLAGQLVGAFAQKHVDEGVSQIISDPETKPADKINAVQAKFGQAGVQSLTKQLQAQALQQQIAASGQQQRYVAAETTGKELSNRITADTQGDAVLKAKLANTLLGNQAATEAAKPGLLASEAAINAAKEPLLRAQTATEGERANLIGEQTVTQGAQRGLIGQEIAQKNVQTGLLQDQRALMKAFVDDPASLDKILTDQGVTDPADIARVRSGLATGGLKGAQSAIAEIQKEAATARRQKTAQEKPTLLPTEYYKTQKGSDTQATAAESYMQAFLAAPEKSGLLGGGNLKGWLESKGVATGDLNIITQYETALQTTAQKATAGGGFFSQGRVNLARDITPTLSKSALGNLVAMDQVADQNISELKSTITQLEGMPQYKGGLEAYKQTLAKWERVKETTGSLSSYVTADKQHSVVLFQGNMVNPKTLAPLVRSDIQYKFKDGSTYSGAKFISIGQQQGLSPAQVAQAIASQHGGFVKE